MSNEVMSLVIIFAFVIGATAVGLVPGMRQKMNLEQWAIGGRSFGRALNWFVLAGEIYTAFAFLGASGWAYARGGPTFYILGYGGLAYMVSYFILPSLSPLGRKNNYLTQADFIEDRYQSKNLGILVAIIGVAFVLPYLQLQLTGLGIIIEACSYGLITRVPAMLIAFTMVATFVYVSGLRGVATTAVIKDIVMAIAVVYFGIYLPVHYFGSVGGMFEALEAAKPGFLALPGGTKNLDVSWLMSTLVLTSLGFYMWPHIFANSYSAKDPDVLRHNAMFLPLYQFSLLFPMLIGFTAILVLVPALERGDMAFMALVQQTFPGWVLGLVGGAGALASMIPAADLLLASSVVISHNVYGKTVGTDSSKESIAQIARILVLVLTGLALALAIYAPNMLVNLLLTGYSGVTQFFPLVLFGLYWKRANKLAAYSGLIVGEILVFYLVLNKLDPLPWLGMNLNAGFVALVVNFVIFTVISAVCGNADAKTGSAAAAK